MEAESVVVLLGALNDHRVPPRAVDHHDVPLLCERFGIDLPDALS
jgi:hypothetical protein